VANDTGGLFQTLVAGASLASQELHYQNAFVDAIYFDYKPEPQQPYTGLNVIIPSVNESDVTDVGSGPLQPADTNHSNVQIPFDKHFSTSFVIKAWDVVRTPVDLKTKFIKPKLEALLRKVNRTLAALVTTTNFPTYTLISGSGADLFNRSDITGAWKNLAGAGAPTEDDGNMFFITNPTAYGNMLSDTNWIQAYAVGDANAISAQRSAKMRTQYGCELRYDQHIANYNSGKQAGIFMHRYSIAAVTSPPMPSGDPSVKETTFRLKGQLPVQMQMQYSLKDQGWLINLHSWWGCKVVRPELASLIETA
jgi:hypothetical protein